MSIYFISLFHFLFKVLFYFIFCLCFVLFYFSCKSMEIGVIDKPSILKNYKAHFDLQEKKIRPFILSWNLTTLSSVENQHMHRKRTLPTDLLSPYFVKITHRHCLSLPLAFTVNIRSQICLSKFTVDAYIPTIFLMNILVYFFDTVQNVMKTIIHNQAFNKYNQPQVQPKLQLKMSQRITLISMNKTSLLLVKHRQAHTPRSRKHIRLDHLSASKMGSV